MKIIEWCEMSYGGAILADDILQQKETDEFVKIAKQIKEVSVTFKRVTQRAFFARQDQGQPSK